MWIRRRLESLAGIFGIDVLGFAVMSNHLHAVLRSRPDVVKDWSDETVARRWWNLFPQRRNQDGSPAEPADTDLNALMKDAGVLKELRARLSSISWFMRCTSEVIARMANSEEECTGRFWEGRFKAQVLADETAIAACMVYVDLNPVRAGIAATPEESDFTSAQERIRDLKTAEDVATREVESPSEVAPSSGLPATFSPESGEKGRGQVLSPDAKDVKIEHGARAGWLVPVGLESQRKKVRERTTSRRASSKGCLPMSLPEYLQLLDWTGRQLHPAKRGSIATTTPPILDRLELSADLWLLTIQTFRKRRTPNSVTPASLHAVAAAPDSASRRGISKSRRT